MHCPELIVDPQLCLVGLILQLFLFRLDEGGIFFSVEGDEGRQFSQEGYEVLRGDTGVETGSTVDLQ